MSHIAEVYAKDLGVKIGAPRITEHFIPGLPDKYMTIQSSNKMEASTYQYWDIVLHLIKPHLIDAGIEIIQVGGPNEQPVPGISKSFLGCSFKQMNYIIKKALTHVGCDSLPGHVASAYDIPSVILHFNLYKENSKPLWHKKNKCISLEPDFSKVKPSFSYKGKRINEIKAETVAQSILDSLNIQKKIDFKTIYIGSNFAQDIIEVVPNCFSPDLKDQAVNLRADIEFNLNHILNWCQMSDVSLHLKDPVPDEIIHRCSRLKQIVFHYEKRHDELDLNKFLKTLKNKKIHIVILTDDKEKLSEIRLKYFDYLILEDIKNTKKVEAKKYFSKKRFITNGEVFSSESSAKRLDKSNDFVYDDISSKELESLYLYE